MAKTTFQGVVRSYGGQNKESNVFAGTVILSAKGILTGNTSVYSVVKNIDNNQNIVLPAGAQIVDVVHAATGAASKALNLGTTSTAGQANSTSIAFALSADGVQSALAGNDLGSFAKTPLTVNTTVYGAGTGTSTISSTTSVIINYIIVDNGQPGEVGPA
jgi:hypothetical protein